MAVILFLILRIKLHAFVALLLGGLLIGVAAGMPLAKVLISVTDGMANTLGVIAVLVGLGAMFGQMLEASGGADALARALVARFGEKNAPWSLTLTGFLVAIPVFFDIGFIILVPIVYGLTVRTGNSIISYGLPLLIGLATAHAFIPPTPGPIAVATLLQADIGWVILFVAIAWFLVAGSAGDAVLAQEQFERGFSQGADGIGVGADDHAGHDILGRPGNHAGLSVGQRRIPLSVSADG